MKKLILFGLPLILLAFGLVVLGCSSDSGNDDANVSSEWEPWVATGTDGGSAMKVTITTTRPRLILTPSNGDIYTIEKDGTVVSSGSILVTSMQVLTFYQSVPETAVFEGLLNGGILSFTNGPYAGFKQTSGVGAGDVTGDRDKPFADKMISYYAIKGNGNAEDAVLNAPTGEETTYIEFHFSESVNLTLNDISISNGTGTAKIGEDPDRPPTAADLVINGDTTFWELNVSNVKTGVVYVSIQKKGIGSLDKYVDPDKKAVVVFDKHATTNYGFTFGDLARTTGVEGNRSYKDTESLSFSLVNATGDALKTPLKLSDIVITGFEDFDPTGVGGVGVAGAGRVVLGELVSVGPDSSSPIKNLYEVKFKKSNNSFVEKQGGLVVWINHEEVFPGIDQIGVYKNAPLNYEVVQVGGKAGNGVVDPSTLTTAFDFIFDVPVFTGNGGHSLDVPLDANTQVEFWEPSYEDDNPKTGAIGATIMAGAGGTLLGKGTLAASPTTSGWVNGQANGGTAADRIISAALTEPVSGTYPNRYAVRATINPANTNVHPGRIKVRLVLNGVSKKETPVDIYTAPGAASVSTSVGTHKLTIVMPKQVVTPLTAANLFVTPNTPSTTTMDVTTTTPPLTTDGKTWVFDFSGTIANPNTYDIKITHPELSGGETPLTGQIMGT
ncbi:MAG: hypothetical protein LBH43_01780 [Treponema sp.]|jgi:hypothetical protein|nr:hypothetical protein [Treponema sp.]